MPAKKWSDYSPVPIDLFEGQSDFLQLEFHLSWVVWSVVVATSPVRLVIFTILVRFLLLVTSTSTTFIVSKIVVFIIVVGFLLIAPTSH